MIEIRPDPERPRGGFAELTVEGARRSDDPVEVAVYNSYQQKWLGPDGWQPGRAGLPARRATWDGDVLRVVVGPDVVNRIDEDTPVRIEVAGVSEDLYWPDTINHGPDIALEGDLGATGARPEPAAPKAATRVGSAPRAEADDAGGGAQAETLLTGRAGGDTEDAKDAAADEVEDADEEPDGGRSRLPLVLAGVAVLAIAGAAAWYVLNQPGSAPDPVPDRDVITRTAPPSGGCGPESLAALDGGFGAVTDRMRACADALSADDALGLVERAAAADDPAALALFGALYDGDVTEDGIETTMGLSFGDDPARAAEYYARAVAAGAATGPDRLAAVCGRLAEASDTLSRSAHEDYCQ